jgi:hypothetical protein
VCLGRIITTIIIMLHGACSTIGCLRGSMGVTMRERGGASEVKSLCRSVESVGSRLESVGGPGKYKSPLSLL